MMKSSLKTSVLAIGIMASIGGAFATKVKEAPTTKQTAVYDWVKTGSPPYRGTESGARSTYACYGIQYTCAVGELVSGVGESPLIIFYS
jgi:hypothetical protein